MITFDTPYEGVIKQKKTDSKIIIKLLDAEIESAKLKQLSSKFLYSLSITPMSNYTKITASVPKNIHLRASKTTDGYGLRLRFNIKPDTKKDIQQDDVKNPLSILPTKKDDALSKDYYIVISILIIGILILLFIKNKTSSSKTKKQPNSWLFKENTQENKTKQNIQEDDTSDASIRFKKKLDDANSVVMLDFAQQSYLIVIGNGNILLDKFKDNKPQTQDEFDAILQERHKELNEFLKANSQIQDEQTSKPKDALEAYTQKAASISYEV
jgi:hypothetical protein